MKYWHILMKDKECKVAFFSEAPIGSYKCQKKLSEMCTEADPVVSSGLVTAR